MSDACEHRHDQQTYDADAKLFTCACGMVRENDDAAVFHLPTVATVNPHEMNAADLKAHIATADKPALESLQAAETQHPDFEGGRSSVLKAIAARLEEIAGA